MTPVLRFVGVGWTFFWRQPALVRASLLLVFLPLLASYALSAPADGQRPESMAVLVVLHLTAIILLVWGIACVLTVGKRLLQAKSGRTRTSFRAVQSQARGLIVPLLLTDILRACIAFLWGLPLLAFVLGFVVYTDDLFSGMTAMQAANEYPWLWLVGVAAAALSLLPAVYLLQTVLAPFVVAYEKLAFRPALARSKQLTRGRLPYTLVVSVLLLFLWLPGALAATVIGATLHADVAVLIDAPLTAFLDAFSLVLWLLAMTQYFKALGGKAKAADAGNG